MDIYLLEKNDKECRLFNTESKRYKEETKGKEKVFSDYQQTIANHDYTARNLPSSFFSFDPEILFSPWSLKAVLVTVL